MSFLATATPVQAPQRYTWPITPERALPGDFRFATGRDALREFFSDYREKWGDSPSHVTTQKTAAHVGIVDARLWNDGPKPYLLVRFGVELDTQEGFGLGRCGVCYAGNDLALFERSSERLRLVASFIPGEDFEDNGHHVLEFDLAPYRLTDRETLIGIRKSQYVMGGAFRQLALLRIVGNRLRVVADSLPLFEQSGFQKTARQTVISMQPGTGMFNDIRAVSMDVDCAADDSDSCRPAAAPKRAVTVFHFNGNVYRGALARR